MLARVWNSTAAPMLVLRATLPVMPASQIDKRLFFKSFFLPFFGAG